MAARNEPLERPVVLLLACFPTPFFSHHLLNAVEQFLRNHRLMNSPVPFSCPIEVTEVDRIREDLMDNALV